MEQAGMGSGESGAGRSSGWDETLYYESAVDILTSLIAACSANEWRAEHGGEVDFVTADYLHGLRRAYLHELAELDPANHAEVARCIREYGTRLAELGATPEITPRADPEGFRLAPDNHRAIFEQKIVPDLLGDIRPHDPKPLAVIVSGQPGSGKSTTIARLRRDWPGAAGVVAIDPELLLAYHPRGWDLVRADDPAAGDIVMWDALGWAALAVEHAIARRGDVLLEVGTNLPDDALAYATAFGDAGYRVEMDVMAVPEAISALNVAIRYRCRHGNWQVLTLP